MSQGTTTLMLRNLPNEVTHSMLEEVLDKEFQACYDFLYLPAEIATGAPFGYAFVNMINEKEAVRFQTRFQGFSEWPVPCSKCTMAHWNEPQQGLGPLIERYRNSPLMHASVPEIIRPATYREGVRTRFPSPRAEVLPPRLRAKQKGRHSAVEHV